MTTFITDFVWQAWARPLCVQWSALFCFTIMLWYILSTQTDKQTAPFILCRARALIWISDDQTLISSRWSNSFEKRFCQLWWHINADGRQQDSSIWDQPTLRGFCHPEGFHLQVMAGVENSHILFVGIYFTFLWYFTLFEFICLCLGAWIDKDMLESKILAQISEYIRK